MCALGAWLGVGALSALSVGLVWVGAERSGSVSWFGLVLRRVVSEVWFGVGSVLVRGWFGDSRSVRLALARVDSSRCGSAVVRVGSFGSRRFRVGWFTFSSPCRLLCRSVFVQVWCLAFVGGCFKRS